MSRHGFDVEDFLFFSGAAFVGLIILLVLTGLAFAIAEVVGVVMLYVMLAVACVIGYYITAHTNL